MSFHTDGWLKNVPVSSSMSNFMIIDHLSIVVVGVKMGIYEVFVLGYDIGRSLIKVTHWHGHIRVMAAWLYTWTCTLILGLLRWGLLFLVCGGHMVLWDLIFSRVSGRLCVGGADMYHSHILGPHKPCIGS